MRTARFSGAVALGTAACLIVAVPVVLWSIRRWSRE